MPFAKSAPPLEQTGRDIAFLLFPKFSMLAFTCAVEPLRVANQLLGRTCYRWSTASAAGGTVMASNGMTLVPDRRLEEVGTPNMLILCAGFDPQDSFSDTLASPLRRLDRQGTILGAIDSGSLLLARTGLLDGHAATTHWECLDSLAEQYPQVEVQPSIFVIDRRRLTCAGGTAALDMMLHLIRIDCGHRIAVAVSEQFIHPAIRDAGSSQRADMPQRLGVCHPRLAAAVRIMERNLEEPLALQELAERAGLSLRQMERLFHAALGQSPTSYYLWLRVERARSLVLYSGHSLAEIAVACGFGSYEGFSRTYRRHAGASPSRDRASARLQPTPAATTVRMGA
ncbi:GlxA family transcriptional regulator [Skermanella mucosa]|uniref:GlxA family transcriptional regulator n=1 Tax=Skermanella mucosa TaxID=1789672 RepID=UPI00192B426E|nr:GlxA family transcriptional regulator [Skermanella mucosa]UEM23691.1 GlxA family transcriptional regulator [Skermanella mucosa]